MKKLIEHIFVFVVVITVCAMTACQEFDPFDENTERAVKYEKQFSDAIGAPAPRHAWGFDLATSLMGVGGAQTRAIYKQDMNVKTTNEKGEEVWVRVTEFYGKPANITESEHEEVFAWFTNHRVNWQNDYANCGDGTSFTGSTKQFDGKAYTRSGEEGYTMLDMGSLVTKSPSKIGTCSVDNTIFFNGWIQHVAYDAAYDEVADNGSTYNSSQMNQLRIVNANGGGTQHLNDFNASNGYGWGNQDYQNGILVTDVNFNDLEYICSADGLYHDKYILVHLVGSDYSGWYLGMDFEGGGQNGNQRVKADGVCNDWIVKICDAGQSIFNPARILCEDLGSNDFDFNDVVFDVAAEVGANCALATVTVKAVGGTIPVCITYGHADDIEGNAFKKDGKFELHELFGAAVNQPINVHANGGLETAREISWKIGFGKEYAEADYYYPDEQLDLQKFNVLVQHTSKAEWLTIRNYDEGNAVCAPQMICVPTTVDWPNENQPIVEKYPKFKEWVANPTKFFWTSNTNSGSSTNSGSNAGTTTEGNSGSNTGSGNTEVIDPTPSASFAELFGTKVMEASLSNTQGLSNQKYVIDTKSLPASGKIALTFVNVGNDQYNSMNVEIHGAVFDTVSNQYYHHWTTESLGGTYQKNVAADPVYETISITIDASEYAKYDMLMLIGSNTKTLEGAYYKLVQ